MRSLYLGKIRQDLYKGSPGKISIRDLCTRSLYQSSVGKISVRDLMARSLHRSLEEVSWQDLLDHSLCEPAQSKCPQHRKSHFIRKFTGKMPRPRLGPKARRSRCASLGSRNACQDFTGATLCGNLQVKCRRPAWATWSSTGLYTYRKNPSAWTHCLGNNANYKITYYKYIV